jgi:hypothetical protein
MRHLDFVHQAYCPKWQVRFISVTESWAQFAVAGPLAKMLLNALLDQRIDDFPFMTYGEVSVEGVKARLFRISFSGEEGYEIVLVNSNPATIMTDPEFADATYVEPLLPGPVAAVIEGADLIALNVLVNSSAVFSPALPAVLRANVRPGMTSPASMPAFANVPMSAADESKSKPSWRNTTPDDAIRPASSVTLTPDCCDALKSRSSLSFWSLAPTPKFLNTVVTDSMLPLSSVPVIRLSLIIWRDISSSGLPLRPSFTLRSETAVATSPMLAGV